MAPTKKDGPEKTGCREIVVKNQIIEMALELVETLGFLEVALCIKEILIETEKVKIIGGYQKV